MTRSSRGFSANEPLKVFEKMTDQRFGLASVAARHVRSDKTIGFRPKRMIVRQRLRFGHVQPGRSDAPRTQGIQQGILI